MLRHIPSTLLLIPLFSAASAIAMPVWQGPYVGGYLGGGFGTSNISTTVGGVTSTSYFTTASDISGVNSAGTFNSNPNALIGGVQVGQDWMWKKVIDGVVVDYGSFSLNSSKSASAIYPDNTNQYCMRTSMSTDWLFTLRDRLGYPIMMYWPALLYATGGMAIMQIKVNNNFNDNSPYAGAGSSQTSSNQIGWTVGAGIEFSLWSHVSTDLEYAYIGMPSVTTAGSVSNTQGGFGPPPESKTSPLSTTEQFHASLVKLGLNYRFAA